MKAEMKQHIVEHLISLVPQWYIADYGTSPNEIEVNGHKQKFYSSRTLTPALRKLLETINLNIDSLIENPLIGQPLFVQVLQEHFAIEWLKSMATGVNWASAVNYLNKVAGRTNENNQVSLNLVISPGEAEEHIGNDCWQKLVDQLASSPFSYIRVNKRIHFMGYEEVRWDEITESTSYRFYPSFLHPIHCILKDGEYSAHVTSNGDIVIMDRSGLLASKRKGRWKLYDMPTFKNCIVGYVKDYWTGANLFELCFDLSFRRHGALLVFDPAHKVLAQVSNPHCRLDTTEAKSGQRLIAPALRNISLSSEGATKDKRRLLAEIASVDGAVIFDTKGVLAFGAVINPHESVGSHIGARTTAALSAYRHGGVPLKISSDGEVTVYFESSDGTNTCDAQLDFH